MTGPDRPPDPAGPKAVSRFEYNLLRVLRFLLGHFPADQGLQLLRHPAVRPPCLSRAAVELVRDSLAKGCVLFLVRAGGWRDERFLRANEPAGGRAWGRTPLDERALAFSAHVVEFLMWATAEKVHESEAGWDARTDEVTAADELFFWRAFDECRADPDLTAVLRPEGRVPPEPAVLARVAGRDRRPGGADPAGLPAVFHRRPGGRPRMPPVRAGRAVDRDRAGEGAGERLAADAAGRPGRGRDLAGVPGRRRRGRAAGPGPVRLAGERGRAEVRPDPAYWAGGLQGNSPPRLADRLDTQRAALAVPRQMATLEGWQDRARSVGYFDDGYAASQLWKRDWDAADGDRVAARARRAVEQVEPLRQRAAGSEQPAAEPQPG